MTANLNAAGELTRVAFLNCFDASLFVAEVELTDDDRRQLDSVLAWLQEAGILLLPSQDQALARMGANDVVEHLRATVGDQIVEAALGADPDRLAGDAPAPSAVLPIWPFEAEGNDPADRDVLLASGRLWGADVLLEALRVEDPDSPEPVREVRSRFDRWTKAAGGSRLRAVIHPPGEKGCYFLVGIAAPM